MSNMSHDIRTPMNAIVGTTVIATARRIQEELGDHVPILLISAYDWGEIKHEAREAGVIGFIAKPLFRFTLLNSLRQFAGVDQETEQAAKTEARRDLTDRRILLAENNELN